MTDQREQNIREQVERFETGYPGQAISHTSHMWDDDHLRHLLSFLDRERDTVRMLRGNLRVCDENRRQEREGHAMARAAARMATELLDRQTKALARSEQGKADLLEALDVLVGFTVAQHYSTAPAPDSDAQLRLFFPTRRQAEAWAKKEAREAGGRWLVWSH